MVSEYTFTSLRLGFRTWRETDLPAFTALNTDPQVMRYFPAPLNPEASRALLKQLQAHYEVYGYTYFATELLDCKRFIGFIGLKFQDYEAPFTPAVDIGWRLRRESWGKGYATEGARRCLEYGFETLGLSSVVATCPTGNVPSERVMQRIGMQKQGEFEHPGLREHPQLNPCLWYEVKKT